MFGGGFWSGVSADVDICGQTPMRACQLVFGRGGLVGALRTPFPPIGDLMVHAAGVLRSCSLLVSQLAYKLFSMR